MGKGNRSPNSAAGGPALHCIKKGRPDFNLDGLFSLLTEFA
jgi:hypothetical protein